MLFQIDFLILNYFLVKWRFKISMHFRADVLKTVSSILLTNYKKLPEI